MSYILEALKKSQRERELGQVPTLADAPYLSGDKPGRGAYWGVVAAILAVLATLIALYGTFGEQLMSSGAPSPSMPEATGKAAPEPEPATPLPAPTSAPDPVAAAPAVTAANEIPRPEKRPEPELKPELEPEAPAAAHSDGRPESDPTPTPAPVKRAEPTAPPARTAIAEPAKATPAPQWLPPLDTPEVPPDLVQDVRRFHEKLRQQKPVEPQQAQEPEPELEAAAAEEPQRTVQTPSAAEAVRPIPPGLSELPPAQQQSIPAHRLTVHVYSSEPEQRFVIINSRKMRQGDQSREGLLLAEITPDGVILEYQGQRFFQHR